MRTHEVVPEVLAPDIVRRLPHQRSCHGRAGHLAARGALAAAPRIPIKASILWHSALFIVQLSHPYMTTGKTIALTRWTFVDKVMSLLFNMLSSFVNRYSLMKLKDACSLEGKL